MATSNDLAVLARRDVAELIEHCRKIVVKDQDLADSLETSESMIEASRYLEVYYKIDKYPYHEIVKAAILEKVVGLDRAEDAVPAADVRASIEAMTDLTSQQRAEALMILDRLTMLSGGITASIVDGDIEAIREYYMDHYTDKNPYYYGLQATHSIPPWKSRLAEDFEILKEPSTTGSPLLRSFSSTYSKIRRYFMTVMYTKAYSKDMMGKTTTGEPINYYKAYCRLVVCTMTIVELMNSKLEFPLDIGYIDEYSVDQLLFSFGFTEFKRFPMYYKKSIALKINTLIRHRGTDNVFVDILDIFDFNGINIIKFYLTKYRSGNDAKQLGEIEVEPRFIGHSVETESLQQAMKNGTHREYSFESMTQGDQYWLATKDEVAAEEFDFLSSKYFSLEGDFRMWRDVMNLAYFVSLIRKLKKDHAFRTHLSLHASEISRNELFIDELILAAQILLIDFYNIEDLIQFEHESIRKIYSFDDKDDSSLNIDVFGADALTPNSYANETYVLERVDSYDTIQDKELEKIFVKNLKVLDNFLAYQDKPSVTGGQIMTYAQYKKYKTLYQTKFLADYNLSEYHGFATYTEYLQFNGNPDLYRYVVEAKESTDQDLKRIRITYLLSALKEYSYFLDIPFDRMMSDLIVEYITTTINVFKSYTVTMKDFKILYRWDEKNFFEMYDGDNKHGYFVWDWKVRLKDFKNKIHPGLGTITNNSYIQPPPRDMNLADSQRFHGWFFRSDRMTPFTERQRFRGWFVKKDRIKFLDKSVFRGRFTGIGRMAFGDRHSKRAYRTLHDALSKFADRHLHRARSKSSETLAYREGVREKARWHSVEQSRLNDLANVSAVITDGMDDSREFFDRLDNEKARWMRSDRERLTDGYYMFMDPLQLTGSDRVSINDWAYLSSDKYNLRETRRFFADLIIPGESSSRLHERFAFATERLKASKRSWLSETAAFGDSHAALSGVVGRDRRSLVDAVHVDGFRAEKVDENAAFLPERVGLKDRCRVQDTASLGDSSSGTASSIAADRRPFADRGFVAGHRSVFAEEALRFTDRNRHSAGRAAIEDTMVPDDLSAVAASDALSDRIAIMDRFEIVVHE